MRTYKEQTALILEKVNRYNGAKKKRMRYIYSLSTVAAACFVIIFSIYALPVIMRNNPAELPAEPPEIVPAEPDVGATGGGGPWGCVHYNPDIISGGSSDNRSMLYFINEEISPNLKSPEENVGGVEYLSYTYPLDLDFLFIESRLTDYVGEDIFREWTRAEYANGTYLYVNVLTFIEHFNLTKEQFIEACSIYPEFPLFGDDLYEVADVLFSGDTEKILRYTKTAGAVYSNGKLFSAEWLDTHTIEDYIASGIDYAELEAAKEATLKAIGGFGINPESRYQEKVAEYKTRSLETGESAHNDYNLGFSENYHSLSIILTSFIYSPGDPGAFERWAEEAGRLSAEHATQQCKSRYFTVDFFIQYFDIKRGDFEKLYYSTDLYSTYEYNIDILYSGDKDKVEEYYSKITPERIAEMQSRAELQNAKNALVEKTFGYVLLSGETVRPEYEAWIRSLDKENIIEWLDENVSAGPGWFLAANSLWSIDEFTDYWGGREVDRAPDLELAPPAVELPPPPVFD